MSSPVFNSDVVHGCAPFFIEEAVHYEVAAYPILLLDGSLDRWSVGYFWFRHCAHTLGTDDMANGLHHVLGNLFLLAMGHQLLESL